MAIRDMPLAQGGIHRDFEAEVLEYLIKHSAKMHGCPVIEVKSKLDGGVVVTFRGWRPGLSATEMWQGDLRFNFPLLKDKKWLNDTTAIGDTALKLLDPIKHPSPVKVAAKG